MFVSVLNGEAKPLNHRDTETQRKTMEGWARRSHGSGFVFSEISFLKVMFSCVYFRITSPIRKHFNRRDRKERRKTNALLFAFSAFFVVKSPRGCAAFFIGFGRAAFGRAHNDSEVSAFVRRADLDRVGRRQVTTARRRGIARARRPCRVPWSPRTAPCLPPAR